MNTLRIVGLVLIMSGMTACTGWGVALGPESIQKAYNDRLKIQYVQEAGEYLNESDRRKLQNLIDRSVK